MEGFCALASGSKGNALFLGTKKTRLLIDCGLSGRATKKRLEEIGIDFETIDAILVSHEHTDHIQGLKVLSLKHGIPVLANHGTAKGIHHAFKKCPEFKLFQTGETFTFGDIEIHPFSIQHDTIDPVAFTLSIDGLKVGICTDLGFATSLVEHHLQDCDYLHIEANHKPDWVHACPRPLVYKQRVLGRNGHLSNEACAELLEKIVHKNLKHINLAHLSEECNAPEEALATVQKKLQEKIDHLKLAIAPQMTIGEKVYF